MKNIVKSFAIAFVVMMSSVASAASDRFSISDASQVQFTVNPGTSPAYVFFRNLDSFGPGWLGCCGNYFIDVSTEGGKAQFSTFLAAYFSRQKIVFYVEKNGGPLGHVGNF